MRVFTVSMVTILASLLTVSILVLKDTHCALPQILFIFLFYCSTAISVEKCLLQTTLLLLTGPLIDGTMLLFTAQAAV